MLTWLGAFILVPVAHFMYRVWDDSKYIPDLRAEFISIALAVLVLEELARYRNHLVYRQATILQMASRSNEFALDAARIVVQEEWHKRDYLKEIDLTGACLQRSNLEDANLEWAQAWEAHFEEADLTNVCLDRADLKNAHFEGGHLWEIHFREADLSGANFKGAKLPNADFQKAILHDVHFEGADLRDAYLDEVNMKNVHLEGANIQGATIRPQKWERVCVDSLTLYDSTTNCSDTRLIDSCTNMDSLNDNEKMNKLKEWNENSNRILDDALSS